MIATTKWSSFFVTRKQLHSLVWSMPMRTLARSIGISDVALAKRCRQSEVPIPPQGYWNKVQAGRPVKRIALPPWDLVPDQYIELSGSLSDELRLVAGPESDEEEEPIDVLTKRLRRRVRSALRNRPISAPVPPMARLLSGEQYRRDQAQENSAWLYTLRIRTPEDQRRHNFMNELFAAFETIGGSYTMCADTKSEQYLAIGGSKIAVIIDYSDDIASRWRNVPLSGPNCLCLFIARVTKWIEGPHIWQDKTGAKLEKQIPKIVVEIGRLAEEWRRAARDQRRKELAAQKEIDDRKRAAQHEIDERERAEERARADRETQEAIVAEKRLRTEELLRNAQEWASATRLREFVDMAAATIRDLPPGTVEAWSAWARAEADKLDPIVNGRLAASIVRGHRDSSVEDASPPKSAE